MKTPAPRLAVVGSINLDLVASAERLPRAGETVGGAVFAMHPGGKGANQALAARRLGGDVQLIGAVGRDAFAGQALALLRQDGVDVSAVVEDPKAATGVALIAVSADGENQIVVAPGANASVATEHAGHFSADALLCQLEISPHASAAAMAAFDGFVALNLAPALELPSKILALADLLIANESEAKFYGEALHAHAAMVALTYGAQGAALFQAGREIARAQAFDVVVRDTTGAGDAFCAALALALTEGQAPQQALMFANAAGGLAATRAGAQSSLPWRRDVEALIAGREMG